MTGAPAKPVLLTGASGNLGLMLTKALAAEGWSVRLTDITPFPDPIPTGAAFTRADLNDGVTILRLAEGCGVIVHLGGVSVERPFEEVLGPNIRGLFHIYEAARREHARVVFASSNHSIGFHERTESIGADTQFLPDGFYGLSKAYGELMGRLYWFKHGVESVFIRIGSCFPEPTNARMLASWMSYPDLARLVVHCVTTESVGCRVVWGASNNARMTWWRDDGREALGWAPTPAPTRSRANLPARSAAIRWKSATWAATSVRWTTRATSRRQDCSAMTDDAGDSAAPCDDRSLSREWIHHQNV
jgi:uronate dehydrogenase